MGARQSNHAGELDVVVNGDPKRLDAACTVAELLVALGMGGQRVAVALNRDIVLRSSYTEVQLTSGDRIEILEAVGGG